MKGHLNSHPVVAVNRIFVDAGAAVNLLPYKTSARLHPHPAQLEEAQGLWLQSKFWRNGACLSSALEDFVTKVTFHVINADTTYKALLGRPWLHENWVVPSTLHQCLKYTLGGKENGKTTRFPIYWRSGEALPHTLGPKECRIEKPAPCQSWDGSEIPNSFHFEVSETPKIQPIL